MTDPSIKSTIDEINKKLDTLEVLTLRRWMNATQAAKYIGYSRASLYNDLKDEIGYSQYGRRIMFDRFDLDKFMENKKV